MEEDAGWADMVRVFRGAGLAEPPVPEGLRARVTAFGRWHWGTHDDPGACEMYMFDPRLPGRLISRGSDPCLSVSHAGHGINSYALTYVLLYRGIAVFTQVGWGGIYMDNERQVAALAEVFAGCRALVERAQQRAGETAGRGGRRRRMLLCVESELRGEAACGWLTLGRRVRDVSGWFSHYPVPPVEPGTALAAAQRLLLAEG